MIKFDTLLLKIKVTLKFGEEQLRDPLAAGKAFLSQAQIPFKFMYSKS